MDAGVRRYGPAPSQEGELLLPSVGPAPVVCLLHGGFWRMPYGRDQLEPVAADLAARGYAVWNISYRRLGERGGGWPGTSSDVGDAVDHLAVLAAEGAALDLDRVVVVGHSAGGQLALWLAAQTKQKIRPVGIAALAAVTDVHATWRLTAGSVESFLGGPPDQQPQRYAEASPLALLPLGVPQLLIHGGRDEALPVTMSRAYAAAARQAGDEVELVELERAGHLDFLDPNGEAHAALCRWLSQRTLRRHTPASTLDE